MPIEVDEAIERNMNALARLYDAQQRDDLDVELRSILVVAARNVRLANEHLSGIVNACALCGHQPMRRVCANCGQGRRP